MFRILMIVLVLIVLATVVVGEEAAATPVPEIIVPTEETAPMPDNFLPADFIEEVTAESPLPTSPSQNLNKKTITFSVNDLPRTSGIPQNSTINSRDTLLNSTPILPTRNESETQKLETKEALPEITAPAFIPSTAISQETLTFEDMIPSDYGLLDRTNGGFDLDVWQGISEARAQNLILPFLENNDSATLDSWIYDKLSTLMLTRSTAPEGSTATDWLAFRAQNLLAMGQSAAAFNLLNKVTSEQRSGDSDLTHAWATTQLMAGQSATVCPSVENQVRNNSTPFWRKNLLLCQLLQGQNQKLALSLNVTTEIEKLADKDFFDALASAQSSKEILLGASSESVAINDVHMNILLANTMNAVRPNREYLSTPYTSTSQAWRDDARANMMSRLHAAEQLALRAPNAPNIAVLKSLYLSVQFSALDVTSPIETAKAQEHPSLGRALLFQATQNAPLPALKASTQAALFDDFSAHNLTMLNRHFVLPQSTLTATPELAWLAPQMIKNALLNNQIDIARNWLKAMQQNDNLSANLIEQRHALALAVDVFQRGNVAQSIALWLNNTSSTNVQSVLAALDALGLSIPAEVWRQAAADNTAQSQFIAEAVGPLWLRMVADGLQNKRTGEVLLLLMQPLKGKNISNIAPLTLANIITGLGYLEQDDLAIDLVMQLLLSDMANTSNHKKAPELPDA